MIESAQARRPYGGVALGVSNPDGEPGARVSRSAIISIAPRPMGVSHFVDHGGDERDVRGDEDRPAWKMHGISIHLACHFMLTAFATISSG